MTNRVRTRNIDLMAKKTFNELINGDVPVLVDFYATWCGPCKTMNPIIKEVAEKTSGRAKIIKIDIDKNQSFANKLQIKGVPTLILYKNGKVVWRQSGVQTATQLLNVIETNS